ncbi:AcrIIA2 family anti-CRISPR protein [Listeria seeligeri]|uniref:AcrIIA2 family anti-CRISPR protein n=1 Tax=Listeria seeligeri TaxID=1640 RepID=UPI0022EC0E99|nr:AcrIIA2 family anti-CRISPR protein [Listeria seeligeri]
MMTGKKVQRRLDLVISELEELTGKDVTRTPQIAEHILNDGDYIVITQTEKYALDLCTTDLEGFDNRFFLDEKLLISTFLEMEKGEDYYIHIVQTTDFGEAEAEEFLATQEHIAANKKQEEQKNVVLKRELD